MSYGRYPNYIYENFQGEVVFHLENGKTAVVPVSALSQYVARLAARGSDAINELIAEHVEAERHQFSDDFKIEVVGGWSRDDD